MTRIAILGGGMVGSAMAADLKQDAGTQVTVVDAREDALARVRERHGVATRRADLSDPAEVRRQAGEADLVIGALSSVLGLPTLRAVVEAGKPYVDISFMADDPLPLDALAKERGVCAVVDCGVAPGMTNMLAGYATTLLDPCERIDMCVGGLPHVRSWPYEYKAGFAPHDVLEEYTRPARLVEHGREVVRPALSEPELLAFEGIGTLEAFNTDGLRSLVQTLKVPFMRERTLRYPGHIELMRVLRETGFFSKEPLRVGGVEVRPLDVTAALLFPKWTFAPGEGDVTVLRVEAFGVRAGRRVRLAWDMVDHHDPKTDTRSMSRTTGYPATIMARMILSGRFAEPGVHPPETCGKVPGLVDEMFAQLEARGVRYVASESAA